jgi:hypothetical protein
MANSWPLRKPTSDISTIISQIFAYLLNFPNIYIFMRLHFVTPAQQRVVTGSKAMQKSTQRQPPITTQLTPNRVKYRPDELLKNLYFNLIVFSKVLLSIRNQITTFLRQTLKNAHFYSYIFWW